MTGIVEMSRAWFQMATRIGQSNLRKTARIRWRRLLCASAPAALAAAAILLAATAAAARITKIQIISRGPAFGGFSFPGVGPYERIVGKGFGEISPTDRHNNVIVDIDLAPRNAAGKVEYSFDFYILKPVDLSKGNHKVFYEAPNRGAKLFGDFNRSTGGNDPASSSDPEEHVPGAAGLHDGLERLGLCGRQRQFRFQPDHHAAHREESGRLLDYRSRIRVHRELPGRADSYPLSYPAATLDHGQGDADPSRAPGRCAAGDPGVRLGVHRQRQRPFGCFPRERSLAPNDIYEFSYTAKDPTVNGIGFAAVRDFNSFLRYAAADSGGTSNPLAGDVTRIYTFAVSQPGRMLNDFRNLGFNEDENGKIVFDGMLQWIAAGDGINMNYRFSQPGRTERNRQDQLYAEGVFPFANQRSTDPITGKTAGRYDKCTTTKTCPLAMEVYSANEYWVKAASLFTTDPTGTKDLPDHPMARDYFISSHQHGTGRQTVKGNCQQFQNPLDSAPVLRALWVALDKWSTKGIAPPPSEVPRLSDGTLVPPLPQSGVGFPKIPGVTYTGLKSTRYLLNYGPKFYSTGIMTIIRRPSNRPSLTTARMGRSTRAMCRRPTPTATTSPASASPM